VSNRPVGVVLINVESDGRKNKQPVIILVDVSAFMAIQCYRQQ